LQLLIASIMKRIVKWILIIFGILVALAGIFAAFVYFSVANRVVLSEPAIFNNKPTFLHLDSSRTSTDSLDRQIASLMKRANVHGLAVSVISHDTLVYQNYFGFKKKDKGTLLSPGTVFYGASLSKPVFGDIVAQLAEQNIIHLDTPLYKYLKDSLYTYKANLWQKLFSKRNYDYTDLRKDNRYKRITARMCLSHSTGLPNWRWLEPDGQLKFLFDPGTRYRYSGEGMALLQFVVEEITKKRIEDLAIEYVFEPLEMKSTSYRWQRAYEDRYCVGHTSDGGTLGIPKTNNANAAGSMSTTLEDYTRFIQAVLKQEKADFVEITSPQIRVKSKQQFGPYAMVDTNDNDSIRLSYGLGFGVYFTPYGKAFFKEGHLDGWQHYTVGFPQSRTAVIIMSNSENAESIFAELVELTIGNKYTPSFWEGYVPYDHISK
jgi:CubicO group peptidase (beta-lactamase class C family)